MTEHKKRYDDYSTSRRFFHEVTKIAATAISVGVIIKFLSGALFIMKEKHIPVHQTITEDMNEIGTNQKLMKKDMTYMIKGIDEIKERLLK